MVAQRFCCTNSSPLITRMRSYDPIAYSAALRICLLLQTLRLGVPSPNWVLTFYSWVLSCPKPQETIKQIYATNPVVSLLLKAVLSVRSVFKATPTFDSVTHTVPYALCNLDPNRQQSTCSAPTEVAYMDGPGGTSVFCSTPLMVGFQTIDKFTRSIAEIDQPNSGVRPDAYMPEVNTLAECADSTAPFFDHNATSSSADSKNSVGNS